MSKEFIIKTEADYQSMLLEVKDGDIIIYESEGGSRLTNSWIDALDRFQEANLETRPEMFRRTNNIK